MFRTTRIIAKATTAIAAVAGTLALAAPHAHAAGWQWADLNRDGRTDSAVQDSDGDGTIDIAYMDATGDGTYDLVLQPEAPWLGIGVIGQGQYWQYDGGTFSIIYLDARRDGRYETVYYTPAGQSSPTHIMIDLNGDGSADGQWIPLNTASTPAAATRAADQLRTSFAFANLMLTQSMNHLWLYGW